MEIKNSPKTRYWTLRRIFDRVVLLVLFGIAPLWFIVPNKTATSLLPPFASEIITTDVGCAGNKVDIFNSKEAVYLDGGRAQFGTGGLSDGSYYIQVTEPDGKLLGTSVPRPAVVVKNGEFAACYQISTILFKASDNSSAGYDTSSTPEGEYKVWVSKNSLFPDEESRTVTLRSTAR